MPTDLLLPAFALTLLANAVLIALAIRALRRVPNESAPPREWVTTAAASRPHPQPPAPLAAPEAPEPPADQGASTPLLTLPPVPFGNTLVHDEHPARDAAATTAAAPDATPGAAGPDSAAASDPEPMTSARARANRPRPTPRSKKTPATTSTPGAEPAVRRGRRKFSLPPIDDDHEKVTRSIESFLAGSDGPAQSTDATPSVSTNDDRPKPTSSGRARAAGSDGSGNTPTTIAMIAIAGLENSSDGRDDDAFDTVAMLERAVRAARVGDDEGIDPVAMLERALRGAARGGDEVHRAGEGRFRIVLPATGELAARAYLRRIRATVEPQLEATDCPLHLVVATATALNMPIRAATITARRRLEAALAAQAVGAGPAAELAGDEGTGDAVRHDNKPEPRAAGD